eukprot:1181871-Karenia_brevis.AAC.1
MDYNQGDLDKVVQHFLGTLPQGVPQGLGSPLIETLAQASLHAVRQRMAYLPYLDMQEADQDTVKAMSRTSAAR